MESFQLFTTMVSIKSSKRCTALRVFGCTGHRTSLIMGNGLVDMEF